jgi:hypothetical protein
MSELNWSPEDRIPTKKHLSHAQAMVERWRKETGNEAARQLRGWQNKVKMITAVWVLFGTSEPDDLTAELDRLYPDAKSRKVVSHNGSRYRKRYFPIETGVHGVVYQWGDYWEGPVASRGRKVA